MIRRTRSKSAKMTDYMGEWARFLDMTNAPAARWVSPQMDTARGTGYFKMSYESAWASSAADLEVSAVPDSWRESAETSWALKLTPLDKAAAMLLCATITGLGKTTLPIEMKAESTYTGTAPDIGTEFGYSREKHAWVFKIAEDNYVLGEFK